MFRLPAVRLHPKGFFALWNLHAFGRARTPECPSFATRSQSSSVSNEEVMKFSQLSSTWWDPRENPLIAMNVVRVDYIASHISPDVSDPSSRLLGLRALDVGCGGGLLSESLARLGAKVTSVDPSEDLVKQAKVHANLDPRTRSIDFRGGWTLEKLAQEESTEKFDVICILEVVEHVSNVDSLLGSVKSLLKPNGKVFLSTLNRTMMSKALAIIGAEYIMRYVPPGTHDWNQFRSPVEMKEIMASHGFEEVDVKGMVVTAPPMFGKWNWKIDAKDTNVNWIATYQLSS